MTRTFTRGLHGFVTDRWLNSFLFLALGPETLFDRPNRYDEQLIVAEEALTQSWYIPYISFKRWGSVPWSRMPIEIVQPLAMAAHLPVLLMTVAYGVCFAYSNVLLTVGASHLWLLI